MRYILHICSVLVLVTIIRGSFLFDDPGDALFLTQYIERGDIETVMLPRYFFLKYCSIRIFLRFVMIQLSIRTARFFYFVGPKSSIGSTY